MVIENPHVTRSVAKANKAKEMMEVEKEQAVGYISLLTLPSFPSHLYPKYI